MNVGLAVGLFEGVHDGFKVGAFEGTHEGLSVGAKDGLVEGFAVGGFVGHSGQPAQTLSPHFMSQEAPLERQNDSQSQRTLVFNSDPIFFFISNKQFSVLKIML